MLTPPPAIELTPCIIGSLGMRSPPYPTPLAEAEILNKLRVHEFRVDEAPVARGGYDPRLVGSHREGNRGNGLKMVV